MRGNLGKLQKKCFSCGLATKKEGGGGEVRVWPLKKTFFNFVPKCTLLAKSLFFFTSMLQYLAKIWLFYSKNVVLFR